MLNLESLYVLAGFAMFYVDDDEFMHVTGEMAVATDGEVADVAAGHLTPPSSIVDASAIAPLSGILPDAHMLIHEFMEFDTEIENPLSA